MAQGSIVAGWIAPHGVVSDMPEERLKLVPETDKAMKIAAARIMEAQPDAVVLVAPHGFRASDINTVSLCRQNWIKLSTWYPWRDDAMAVPGDTEIARLILSECARHNHRAVGLIYGGTSESVYPMDWSITAPMHYLLAAGYEGTLVPITFASEPFVSEWEFGRMVAAGIAQSGKRVAFIASSDLSHVHSAEGPYGLKSIAPEYDAWIEQHVRANALLEMTDVDPQWVAEAAQDGLRSILIMGGAMEGLGFAPQVLAYEVLVYFGMLTAVFTPAA